MELSDMGIWIGVLLFIFFALYVIATLMRNSAAKKDKVGHKEEDSIASSVSINPQKNTRKLE